MQSNPYGKRVTMPCGHIGEHVVSTFAVCLTKGCDGLPLKPGAPKRRSCSRCHSLNMQPFSAPLVPDGAHSCVDCGKVEWSP